MSAMGSNNHLHIICMDIVAFTKKYTHFYFSSRASLGLSLFFYFGKRHGCKKYVHVPSSLLLRKTRAQEGR